MIIDYDGDEFTQLCGTAIKHPVSTNHDAVNVYFYSDYAVNRLGFNMTFTSIKGTVVYPTF